MMRNSNTLDYTSPNRDSSLRLASSSPKPRNHHGNTTNSAPNQTLDHHHTSLSFQPNKPRRDITSNNNSNNNVSDPNIPNPDPDSDSDPDPDPDQITQVNAVSSSVRYRECLKNHAASSGGHVLDGCGEFMPSGVDGTAEAMKCAACECHRNFHRKEIDGECQYNPNKLRSNIDSVVLPHQHYLPAPAQRPNHVNPLHRYHQYHNPDQHHSHTRGRIAAPVMMAFGGAEYSSSEDLSMFDHDHVRQTSRAVISASQQAGEGSSSKKRFRTRFNQEQKEKMMELAEKLGWRIQKHDEQEVQRLCSEVGVKRKVFKVWMHNNKQTMKKKQVWNLLCWEVKFHVEGLQISMDCPGCTYRRVILPFRSSQSGS